MVKSFSKIPNFQNYLGICSYFENRFSKNQVITKLNLKKIYKKKIVELEFHLKIFKKLEFKELKFQNRDIFLNKGIPLNRGIPHFVPHINPIYVKCEPYNTLTQHPINLSVTATIKRIFLDSFYSH